MAAKMEVLKRTDGPRVVPQVVLDPSLSFSFQLPASLRQQLPSSGATRPPAPMQQLHIAPVTAAASQHQMEEEEEEDDWERYDGETPVVAVQTDKNASEEASWEDRDWNEPTTDVANAATRVMDAKMALLTPDGDAWEEADAPDLPDDFPVLLVNLSRLRDLHFRSESDSGGAYTVAMETEDELRDFYATVKKTLHEHFTQMTEVLFEQEICIHAHYGTQRRMLENLHRAYPTHVFALIDYPPELAGLDLHEYLHVLTKPTRWASVNYLKDCLRKCSRDLEWKLEITIELEKLAQQEHDWFTHDQQQKSDEIDALTSLRDSFRAKLASEDSKKTNQYLLLRKLEDIETRLMTLLDAYLKEPELTKRESRELMGFQDAAPSLQMRNVLDMVVAMIFSRLPRDYGAQPTREAHFEMLLDHHLHIRRLWKKDFGRLPARSNAAGGDVTPDEEEEEEEEEEAKEIQLEDDFDQFCRVEDQDVEGMQVDEEDEEEEDGEDRAQIWEDEDEKQEDDELVEDKPKPQADGLDGYGADYESDDSDDETPSPQVTEQAPPSLPKKRVVRRPRRSKARAEGGLDFDTKPERSSKSSAREQSEREKALEAFMYGSSDDSGGAAEAKAVAGLASGSRLWNTSYARTGALSLLRQAKENEGF